MATRQHITFSMVLLNVWEQVEQLRIILELSFITVQVGLFCDITGFHR